MIDLFLALWLTNIKLSRKSQTLYSSARDLGGQNYIWFSLHWTKIDHPTKYKRFSACSAMASN